MPLGFFPAPPQVFNFFPPDYQSVGPVLEAGLVAPEGKLYTAPSLIGFLNGAGERWPPALPCALTFIPALTHICARIPARISPPPRACTPSTRALALTPSSAPSNHPRSAPPALTQPSPSHPPSHLACSLSDPVRAHQLPRRLRLGAEALQYLHWPSDLDGGPA